MNVDNPKVIRQFLASIGSKGGKAGTGESKMRGGVEYYRRISKLAAKARKKKNTKRIVK
jgi:hypothetical protein